MWKSIPVLSIDSIKSFFGRLITLKASLHASDYHYTIRFSVLSTDGLYSSSLRGKKDSTKKTSNKVFCRVTMSRAWSRHHFICFKILIEFH